MAPWTDAPQDGPVDDPTCRRCGDRSNCPHDDSCGRWVALAEIRRELADELDVDACTCTIACIPAGMVGEQVCRLREL